MYIVVTEGLRLKRGLDHNMKQKDPKYKEMCRRFLANEIYYSEKNISQANIKNIFINDNLKECKEEIISFILSKLL